jgi:hypothetical protein
MEGFRSDVRFMPIQTFSAEDAPAKTEFVVFVDGKRLRYESGENLVRVTTDAEGHLLSTCGYEYAHYKQEYPLPGCAVLVPVSQIGEAMIK